MFVSIVDKAIDRGLCEDCKKPGRIGKEIYLDNCCERKVKDIIKQYRGKDYVIIVAFK